MTYREAKKITIGSTVLKDGSYIPVHVVEIEHDEEHHEIIFRCSDGVLYYHTALHLQMSTEEIVTRFLKNHSTQVYIDYNDEAGEWRYAIVVDGSEGFWLDSFTTENEAMQYIKVNNLKMVHKLKI